MRAFQSRLYREEIQRWLLLVLAIAWATSSTVWAISKKDRTLLIGFDESGARLIQGDNDGLLKEESIQFLRSFVGLYLNFDAVNHTDQIGKAADLMSNELWETMKGKFLDVNQKLKEQPLTQVADLEAIDLVGENRFEVVVSIRVRQRLTESQARLKMTLTLQQKGRTSSNPWRYEIVEMRDELL